MLNAADGGNRQPQADQRRDERRRDALSQLVRLGRDGGVGDHGERLHHAVDRAQQAEHRADRADQREIAEPVLEPHVFFFADFLHGLDRLRIAAGEPRQTGRQHLAQKRIVVLGQLVRFLILLGVQMRFEAFDQCDGKSCSRRATSTFMTNTATSENDRKKKMMLYISPNES